MLGILFFHTRISLLRTLPQEEQPAGSLGSREDGRDSRFPTSFPEKERDTCHEHNCTCGVVYPISRITMTNLPSFDFTLKVPSYFFSLKMTFSYLQFILDILYISYLFLRGPKTGAWPGSRARSTPNEYLKSAISTIILLSFVIRTSYDNRRSILIV